MQKLIRRVDALETRPTPTSYLMGRGLSGGRIQYPFPDQGYRPMHHNLHQHHHHVQPRVQPSTHHQPPVYSHVDEQLYQTKQWLKNRTMNLS